MNAVEALESISKSLASTSGWEIAGIIIGGAGLLSTAAVLFFNYKSIVLSETGIRKSVDIQLYEKRRDILSKVMEDRFSDVKLDVSLLFSDSVFNSIKTLIEKQKEYDSFDLHEARYKQFMGNEGMGLLKEYTQLSGYLNDEEEKEYIEFCKKHEYSDGLERFNINEVLKKLARIYQEITKLKKDVCEQMREEIKSSLSV